MARSATLAEMRTSVTRRGGWENSEDITSTVIDELLNEGITEVWDLLVGKWADYYTAEATLATIVGNDAVALPATFYKFRKLEILIAGTLGAADEQMMRLLPHDLESSHRYRTLHGKRYRYRIQAGNLRLVPRPQAIETLRLFHIPWATKLVADGDLFDGINGYEELVIQLAMLRCYKRTGEDTMDTVNEIDRLSRRVRTAADARDAAEPFYLDPDGPPDEDSDEDIV